jgi:hypothetical protein
MQPHHKRIPKVPTARAISPSRKFRDFLSRRAKPQQGFEDRINERALSDFASARMVAPFDPLFLLLYTKSLKTAGFNSPESKSYVF